MSMSDFTKIRNFIGWMSSYTHMHAYRHDDYCQIMFLLCDKEQKWNV